MAAYEMTRAFSSMGFQMYVLTTDKNALLSDQYFSKYVLEIKILLPNTDQIQEKVRSFIEMLAPDVLIINATHDLIFNTLVTTCNNNGIPIIQRSHGYGNTFIPSSHPPFFGFAQWMKSFLKCRRWISSCKYFSQIIFLSSYTDLINAYDRKCAKDLNLSNVSDIPNTFPRIECQTNIDFRKKHAIRGTMFLCIAEFNSRKGQRDAIQAICATKTQNCTFVFISPKNNAYQDTCRSLVHNDDRFLFLNNISRAEVVSALVDCDCVFLYSRKENQPLVLLEAMSCEKPWICTNVGSVCEMRGGVVLKRRRAKYLNQAVLDMQDPTTRDKYGREGYQHWLSSFSPDFVYRRWNKLLLDAISKKPIRGGY